MRTRTFILFIAIDLFLSFHAVFAEVVVISQVRNVSTTAFAASDDETDSDELAEFAPDMAPFDITLASGAIITGATATADAMQNSEISQTFLRSQGSASGFAEVLADDTTAYGIAGSGYAISFTLDQPTPFVLSGFLEANAGGVAMVQLSRPSELLVMRSATGGRIDLDEVGTLAPDTWEFRISNSAHGFLSAPGGPVSGGGAHDVFLVFDEATDVPVTAASAIRIFPNPFRGSTRLIVPPETRGIRILYMRGRLVRTILAESSIRFDGSDDGGRSLASGVYWVQSMSPTPAKATRLVRLR